MPIREHTTEHTARAEQLLRAHGCKVTAPRLAVLDVLQRATRPLSVQAVVKAGCGAGIGAASAYRTLRLLAAKDIVRPVDLRHDHTHYELVPEDDHHHVVCTRCGRVADISGCDVAPLVRAAERSAGFTRITHHAIELFGTCPKCA